MSPYIQREIFRARGVEGVVRCIDARGRPRPGLELSLYQVGSPFHLGARWSEDPPAAVALFARLGTHLLADAPVPDALEQTCGAHALRALAVLRAPQVGEDLTSWRERCLATVPRAHGRERPGAGTIAGWALDCGPAPAPDALLQDAVLRLRAATGQPVTLLGLRLPLRELPPPADAYGVDLGARPGREYHLAPLRRWLCDAAAGLGSCSVHGVTAPDPPKRLPRSWVLGGAERFEAEALVQRVALCFSVPGWRGGWGDDETTRRRDDELEAGRDRDRPCSCCPTPDTRHPTPGRHEWRTRARGTTDAEGCFAWRGFHGTYELTAIGSGGQVSGAERLFEVTETAPTVWEVTVG